ncbi:MAG: hypothetical protein VYD87_10930 [Pseudomonadota bacterium]|nr:hypothetical protein [Pseudomonadota bacterium]
MSDIVELRTFNYHDAERHDLMIVKGEAGFSYSQSEKNFYFFKRERDRSWTALLVPLSELRAFVAVVGSREEFVYMGSNAVGGMRGALHDVGMGIGVAARNYLEKSRARKATGILFELAYIPLPTFFVNISEDGLRLRTTEALRQILEGRDISVKIIDFPVELQAAHHNPSEQRSKTFVKEPPSLKRFFTSPFVYGVISLVLLAISSIGFDEYDRLTRENPSATGWQAETLGEARGILAVGFAFGVAALFFAISRRMQRDEKGASDT